MDDRGNLHFYFVANNVALDFVNTLIVDERDRQLDLFNSFDDLIGWAVAAGIVDSDQAARSKRKLTGDEKSSLFSQAVIFRGQLKEMATAISKAKVVPRSVIDAINAVLASSSGHFELAVTQSGYSQVFRTHDAGQINILGPIAKSAATLLSEGDLDLVRKCQREACVLYFYDNSKRHGRRWCSMSVCGNRAKAAAHYLRTHEK
jgi:predicted RNA-binding Zn ribbon-like protein